MYVTFSDILAANCRQNISGGSPGQGPYRVQMYLLPFSAYRLLVVHA
jgi:hypothetical protein